MAKKKSKPTVVNNIESVNMEIDYDKLAEAIVKAQEKAEEQKNLQELRDEIEVEKLSVCEAFKMFVAIISKKAKSNGTMTSGFLGGIMSLFFNILAIFGVGLIVVIIVSAIATVKEFIWMWESVSFNIFSISLYCTATIITAIISFIFRAVANEIEKEKDRNYIIAVFSAVVAFVALVISVIDIIKGVI
ncbi:MAG: hypothetical protein IKL10_10370 [Clostridia bacterium]|nr:hypothetical protein [Clostridia bacterium]